MCMGMGKGTGALYGPRLGLLDQVKEEEGDGEGEGGYSSRVRCIQVRWVDSPVPTMCIVCIYVTLTPDPDPDPDLGCCTSSIRL